MRIVEFKGYGYHVQTEYVNADRVMNWHRIDYNGRDGTKIILDNGSEVTVADSDYEVARKLKEAA